MPTQFKICGPALSAIAFILLVGLIDLLLVEHPQYSFGLYSSAMLLSFALITRSQNALHQANTELSATLHAIPDLMFELSREGDFLQVWAHGNQSLIHEKELLVGKNVTQIMPVKAARIVLGALEEAEQDGHSAGQVIQLRVGTDDCYFELSTVKKALDDTTFIMISRDITRRKRMEQRDQTRSAILETMARGASLKEALLQIVLACEKESTETRCCVLLLHPDQRVTVGAAPHLPPFFTAILEDLHGTPEVLAGAAVERRVISNIFTDPDYSAFRAMAIKAGIASCWSEPVFDTEGHVIALLCCYHMTTREPHPHEIALVESYASLVSMAVERERTHDELRQAHLIYCNSSEAMVVTDANNVIISANPAFTRMTGYTLQEVTGKNPHLLSSGRHNERFYQDMWAALDQGGKWQGEIWNRRKDGEEFPEWLTIDTIYSEDGRVERRVAIFSDITEKKKNEELIAWQANYDHLTQLPNRRLFLDRLDFMLRKSLRDKDVLAVVFIDLDRFKEVNDALGHRTGDLLLVEAARRIRSCIRDSDTVARLGGDEFVLMLPGFQHLTDIERVVQNIQIALAKPFYLEMEQVFISGSIGITVYPEDGLDAQTLMSNADQAMYAAKSSGRNCFRWYTLSMQEAAQFRMRLANDLRLALGQDQFRVLYQPIVEMGSGRIHKAEALLRWHHPDRGVISPVIFVPIAEETGAIHAIGDWIFHQAAAKAIEWRTIYPDFQISVNKSPVQLRNDDPKRVGWADYLLQISLPGQAIVVEITEGVMLEKQDEVINRKLLKFRDVGMQVAIDDFGTGYSSLSYLKKFDIDYLKIDQAFTRNLIRESSEHAICEAIIVMAHKLGLKVIAEGVETEEQMLLLMEMGCDYGQGYLFSPPLQADEFEILLHMANRYSPLPKEWISQSA